MSDTRKDEGLQALGNEAKYERLNPFDGTEIH